jgi:hypothetical protein
VVFTGWSVPGSTPDSEPLADPVGSFVVTAYTDGKDQQFLLDPKTGRYRVTPGNERVLSVAPDLRHAVLTAPDPLALSLVSTAASALAPQPLAFVHAAWSPSGGRLAGLRTDRSDALTLVTVANGSASTVVIPELTGRRLSRLLWLDDDRLAVAVESARDFAAERELAIVDVTGAVLRRWPVQQALMGAAGPDQILLQPLNSQEGTQASITQTLRVATPLIRTDQDGFALERFDVPSGKVSGSTVVASPPPIPVLGYQLSDIVRQDPDRAVVQVRYVARGGATRILSMELDLLTGSWSPFTGQTADQVDNVMVGSSAGLGPMARDLSFDLR